ncbi:acetate--CoA ligase family protein [Jannaschia sp. Os4]|uniref:acetate--CoA ligase family protein n=1 Tax=Jannaschia sp. Os4 TaxID=2807617 RepID=UPI0023AF4A8E|nr:acetate--CoA ligase family protein [Jannaschia sp. Os4]
MSRLLAPRTLAVLGGRWAEAVVAKATAAGMTVWPVHPTRREMGGVPCVPALADLPAAPDAVFLGVNRDATVPLVADLTAMGAGGAVVFASGWAETGDVARQDALVAAAGGMPILGPNCYGLLNYLDGAAVWPDEHGGMPVARGVGLIVQSSNLGINLTMQARALPLGRLACLGNAAQVGVADLGHAMLDDPRVTALGLHLEGMDPALADLCERAQATGRGVVVLAGGRSEGGRAAAVSHTAALTGDGTATAAFLRRIGAVQVRSPSEFLEALKVAHALGPVRPRRVAVMACSGGEAGLAADLAQDLGLDLPPPDAATAAALADELGPMVRPANPLDYHTFVWGDRARMARTFRTMARGYDAALVVIDPPDRTEASGFEPALDAIADGADLPLIPVASIPEAMSEARAASLMDRGLCPLSGLETALSVMAAHARAGTPGPWRPVPPQPPRATRLVPEDAAKRAVADAVPVPRGVTAPDLATLADRARPLAAPFALKALGHAHKTEAGAVRLHVRDLAAAAPMDGTGYLAEEMAEGVEMLVGLRRDAILGATLTLGWGGTRTELIGDTATLILPATPDEIGAALAGCRVDALLRGYRGAPPADRPAAIAAIHALCDLFLARPAWEELEINPLMAGPARAVAVDVLLREAP